MLRPSTSHYQEVRCMYVAYGTCKMTVISLTVILEVRVPFVIYTFYLLMKSR
jgi:hypothetical protein